jgi:putative membrane protein
LFFRVWHLLRGLLIPLVLFLFVGREWRGIGFIMVLLAWPIVASVIRYFTFEYWIQGGELILKHGLLARTERHISLRRVQDVRLEQGVLHRLFGVVDVQVDTAGGEGPDAVLSVLSKSEAERLRSMVFAQLGEVAGALKESTPAEKTATVLRRISVRELIFAGMTSNKLASLIALLVIAERLGGDFLREEANQRSVETWTESATKWVESQSVEVWVWIAAGLAALSVLGMLLSVVASVIMFYGFTLALAGEDLHRSYGLLTRRFSSLPRQRIQVLKIEERLLRRLFRLATLRADTASGKHEHHEEKSGRDVLLPVVPRREVGGLLPAFFPDWKSEESGWTQVSRRAIYRATLKGTLVCGCASALLYWRQHDWTAWVPLLFVPIVFWLSVMSYRYLGYGLGSTFFRTRRGWLSRATHIVPIRNAQVIVVEQNPLDRRHRVATLIVDTAGQAYTGGGPRIHNVPAADAVALARTLARQAAALRYRV